MWDREEQLERERDEREQERLAEIERTDRLWEKADMPDMHPDVFAALVKQRERDGKS